MKNQHTLKECPELKASQIKARESLISIMLALAGYNLVGDFGIAGILIYQSRSGEYIKIKRW